MSAQDNGDQNGWGVGADDDDGQGWGFGGDQSSSSDASGWGSNADDSWGDRASFPSLPPLRRRRVEITADYLPDYKIGNYRNRRRTGSSLVESERNRRRLQEDFCSIVQVMEGLLEQ